MAETQEEISTQLPTRNPVKNTEKFQGVDACRIAEKGGAAPRSWSERQIERPRATAADLEATASTGDEQVEKETAANSEELTAEEDRCGDTHAGVPGIRFKNRL